MERDDPDQRGADAGFGEIEPEGVARVDPGSLHYDRPVDRFRRTAVGSVLAAGMFGLADVLEGREKREEPAIVTEAPTRPDDSPVRLLLDPEHPDRSVVIVRRPVVDDDR